MRLFNYNDAHNFIRMKMLNWDWNDGTSWWPNAHSNYPKVNFWYKTWKWYHSYGNVINRNAALPMRYTNHNKYNFHFCCCRSVASVSPFPIELTHLNQSVYSDSNQYQQFQFYMFYGYAHRSQRSHCSPFTPHAKNIRWIHVRFVVFVFLASFHFSLLPPTCNLWYFADIIPVHSIEKNPTIWTELVPFGSLHAYIP